MFYCTDLSHSDDGCDSETCTGPNPPRMDTCGTDEYPCAGCELDRFYRRQIDGPAYDRADNHGRERNAAGPDSTEDRG